MLILSISFQYFLINADRMAWLKRLRSVWLWPVAASLQCSCFAEPLAAWVGSDVSVLICVLMSLSLRLPSACTAWPCWWAPGSPGQCIWGTAPSALSAAFSRWPRRPCQGWRAPSWGHTHTHADRTTEQKAGVKACWSHWVCATTTTQHEPYSPITQTMNLYLYLSFFYPRFIKCFLNLVFVKCCLEKGMEKLWWFWKYVMCYLYTHTHTIIFKILQRKRNALKRTVYNKINMVLKIA